MANARQQTVVDDEGAGYLISVADMMSGLLFVFIITLMAFVINLREAEKNMKQREREKQEQIRALTNQEEVREALLKTIKSELDKRGIQVEVVAEQGVLRLREKAVRFLSGKAYLTGRDRMNVETIAAVLADVLPCYVQRADFTPHHCSDNTADRLDSVFIEGHTDNMPINNDQFKSNWELSAQRAIESYRVMITSSPELGRLKNQAEESLFSVSGYGFDRPVNKHDKPTDDEVNRRIDLRFIMTVPKGVENEVASDMRSRGIE